MDERQRMEELQDTDFKYVMQDTGNIYIGARLTYAELMDQEMLPFKMKTIIQHYFLKETSLETTQESEFYYLEKGSFLYETFAQLRIKVKVNVLTEKKSLFGKKKMVYTEKILTLKELTEMNLARKKASGMIIREIIVSKLGLMTFSI